VTQLEPVSLASELQALRRRLADRGSDPALAELVDGLHSTFEQLELAEADVVERNRRVRVLHETLAAEAARYRNLFDSAPVAYVTTDVIGTIIDANAATADLLRIDVRSLLGQTLPIYVVPDQRRAFRSQLLRLGQDGGSIDRHIRMRRADRTIFEAAVRASAVAGEVAWVIVDETDRRRAETEIRELNARLEARVVSQTREVEAVLEQLPIGAVIVDAMQRVVRMNRRARELTGSSAAWELNTRGSPTPRRRPDGTPLPPDEWPIARALRGEVVARDVYRVVLSDHAQPFIESSASPIRRDDGTIVGAVTVFDDVTEREQRERADREFVSNAAHQIRTPITAIASAVAALNAGAIDDPAARRRFVNHIEADVFRLSRLAEALLALARLHRGETAPALTTVALRPLLAGLLREAKPQPGVRCRLTCSRSLAAVTNEGLVEEALSSILANATESTTDGEIKIVGRARGDRAIIEVRDTGPGIPVDEQAHVFTRFYRGAGRRSRGAGLGLAIAADATRAAGGRLELESEVGVGTTMRLSLRLAEVG
jgi:PAS domain S-box-containing protein